MITWVPGDRIPRSPPQLGSQSRGAGGCTGTNGVGAMNIQAVSPHANYVGTDSEQPMAIRPNDKPETLSCDPWCDPWGPYMMQRLGWENPSV